jgi:hypothetical protein
MSAGAQVTFGKEPNLKMIFSTRGAKLNAPSSAAVRKMYFTIVSSQVHNLSGSPPLPYNRPSR